MMKPLACGMALTIFLQLIQSKIDLVVLLALTFCTVLHGYRNVGKKSYRCISILYINRVAQVFFYNLIIKPTIKVAIIAMKICCHIFITVIKE